MLSNPEILVRVHSIIVLSLNLRSLQEVNATLDLCENLTSVRFSLKIEPCIRYWPLPAILVGNFYGSALHISSCTQCNINFIKLVIPVMSISFAEADLCPRWVQPCFLWCTGGGALS